MALTKIFTGMEQGPEMIDKNFNDNLLEISAWSDSGISYINGFAQHPTDVPNRLKYRTIKLGGVLIETQFEGWFATPALTSSLGLVEICKLPSGIFGSAFKIESNKIECISTGQYINYGLNTNDSALTINLWSLTKEKAAGAILTNLCVSW